MKSEDVAKKGSEMASKAKEKAGEVGEAAERKAERTKEQAQAWAGRFEASGRRAADGAHEVMGSLQEAREQFNAAVQEQAEKRPYQALGVAAVVGFVLAGGLTIGLTRRLVGLGGRLLMGAAAKRIFG